MNKKIYVIDRNGRMHPIAIDPTLTINGTLVTSDDHAEKLLDTVWSAQADLCVKNSNSLKVFNTKKLLGYQIAPLEE